MHDIAQNVARKEICAFDTTGGNVDKNVRHLSIINKSELERYYSLGKTYIRSLLFYHSKDYSELALEALIQNFRCLRVLDLSNEDIKRLPDSIGELLHLRYLDLSRNEELEALPNSITKLCNLQTLLLSGCLELIELPKEFSRLNKLRVLSIAGCRKLTSMPKSMGKLTCLHTLEGKYIVGVKKGRRCTSWQQWFDGLRDLKTLINLKAELEIIIRWPSNANNGVKEDGEEGLYLSSMEHLNYIRLRFESQEGGERAEDEGIITMKVMENLRPHSNLKSLVVDRYDGVKMPGWITLLPNLVMLYLCDCKELKYLSSLGNLSHLNYLHLQGLLELKYIEVGTKSSFPSLENLVLEDLPKFKGWGRHQAITTGSTFEPHLVQCLFQLKKLTVVQCPELLCIVVCPILEALKCNGCSNGKWQIVWGNKADEILLSESATIRGNESNGGWLNLKSLECFHSLRTLEIYRDDELVVLPRWMQSMSALQTLDIRCCRNLKAMPEWIAKLTSLKRLTVASCSKGFKERCRKDPPGEDWPYIQHIPNIRVSTNVLLPEFV